MLRLPRRLAFKLSLVRILFLNRRGGTGGYVLDKDEDALLLLLLLLSEVEDDDKGKEEVARGEDLLRSMDEDRVFAGLRFCDKLRVE